MLLKFHSLLLQYNFIPYSFCCYCTASSSIPYMATVQNRHLFLMLLYTTSSSISYVAKTSSFIPFLIQYNLTLYSLCCYNLILHYSWHIILSSFCCYCTASYSIPYVATVQTRPLFLMLLQPHPLILLFTTSSSIPYVATTSSSIPFLATVQPHPLFLILLPPHPVLLYAALTSSSIPYVAISFSIPYVSTTS